MVRRRRNKGRGRGMTIDMTAWKIGGLLFKSYNGPNTVRKIQSRDWGGAMDAWGEGNLGEVVGNSIFGGAGYRVKEKLTRGVKLVRSRMFNLKF